MKRISKEEYSKEVELLANRCRELKKRIRELDILDCHSHNGLEESLNSEYKTIFNEYREKEPISYALQELLDNPKYNRFYYDYCHVVEYFKNKYQDDIELPDSIKVKADFILNNYVPYKDDMPEMNIGISDCSYIEREEFVCETKDEVKEIQEYFKDKKRNFIYVWEVEYLIFVLFADKVNNSGITNSLFGEPAPIEDRELKELNDNFDIVIKKLTEEHKLYLSLYLWSIYKTYHYFFKKSRELIYDRADFSLIDKLLESAFTFFQSLKFNVEEAKLKLGYRQFAQHICGLLAHDLLSTLISDFPDYYDKTIMFLGSGCYHPAGCSSLTTSMKTFDGFLEGIGDYNFWFDENINGTNAVLNKFNINKDYDSLKKNID